LDHETVNALNRAVRAIQNTLLTNGTCDVGTVDGIVGPHTAAAMRNAWGAQVSVVSILRQRHAAA
jgi:hypothetical protein